jgi:hypothetical protein
MTANHPIWIQNGLADSDPLRPFRSSGMLHAMIDPCCLMMKLYGRDHYSGVPENELPDAIIERHPAVGAALLLMPSGRYEMYIQHCPWCGARVGKDRQDLPTGFDPSA